MLLFEISGQFFCCLSNNFEIAHYCIDRFVISEKRTSIQPGGIAVNLTERRANILEQATTFTLPLALRRQRVTDVGFDLPDISGTDRTARIHVFAEI